MKGLSNGCLRVVGVLVTLSLCAGAAVASPRGEPRHCTREDVQSADQGGGAVDWERAGEAAAISAEVARPLPPAPLRSYEPTTPRRAWTARFVDSFDVGARLKALSRLRILRLWDSSRVTVFFGLDHAGHAGLHVQQQDPSYLPPMRMKATPLDLPPLRAVPLGSM